MPLPVDSTIQAEYADGFILDENATGDKTQWPHLIPKDENGDNTEGNNTFADVLFKRPEAEHGPLVRFSVFWKDKRYDIDWRDMPESARPIRFRDAEQQSVGGVVTSFRWTGVNFGYQYNDENGQNQQYVEQLR